MTGQTIKFVDASGNLRNLPNILFDIGEATKDLGTAEAGGLVSELFGLRAVTGALVVGGGKSPFQEMVRLLKESRGEAKKTAAVMDSGLGGTFRRLLSAVEGIAIAIGESLAGPLIKLGEFMAGEFLANITTWIEKNKEIIKTVAAVVVGVGALGVALVVTGAALSLVGFALGTIGGLIGLLTSPFVIATAAIVGIGVALFKFSEDFRSVIGGIVSFGTNKFAVMGETISTTFAGISSAIRQGDFTAAFEILTLGAEAIWLQFIDVMKSAWLGFTKFFVEVWEGAVLFAKNLALSLEEGLLTTIELLERAVAPAGEVVGSQVAAALEESGIVERTPEESRSAKFARLRQENLDAAGQSLADFERGIKTLNQERQKEIAARQEALKQLVNEVQAREVAAVQVEEAAEKLSGAISDAEGGPAAAGPGVPLKALTGLEAGTVEAARAAFENAQRDLASEQLDVAKQQLNEQVVLNQKIDNIGLEAV